MFQLILPILLTTCIYAYDESLSKYIVELAQATYSISSIDDWNCITCNTEIKLDYVVEQDSNLALQGQLLEGRLIYTIGWKILKYVKLHHIMIVLLLLKKDSIKHIIM